MKKIVFCYLFIFISFLGLTQNKETKIVSTSGEAQVEWNKDHESMAQAKERAQNLATVNALEKAFGVVIVQGNSTYIKNKVTGQQVETNTQFNMIGNSIVRGEVIEIEDIKFKEIKYTKKIDRKKVQFMDIKCNITVKAKEITDTRLELEVKTLACTNIKCASTVFKNGDDFFMYFKSPVNGYLTIYLDDTKNTARILPYMEMPEETENNFKIQADKEYILFSNKEEFNYFTDKYFEEDTYQLTCETEKDLNRIIVIFSQKTLNKPNLKKDLDESKYTEYLQKGYQMPMQTTSEEFQKWLVKNRSIRDDVQVEMIDVTIEK
jgi:hypothetical protein